MQLAAARRPADSHLRQFPSPNFGGILIMSMMPITDNIADILHMTGAITAATLAQFLAPRAFLKHISKIEMTDEASLLFARHWGLLAFVIGALLMYAGSHAEIRQPVVAAALLEKAGLVAFIFRDWRKDYTKGLRVAALFDAACVLAYGLYLLNWA